jgi:hypothetical protein
MHEDDEYMAVAMAVDPDTGDVIAFALTCDRGEIDPDEVRQAIRAAVGEVTN